jgi:hypothetical protein
MGSTLKMKGTPPKWQYAIAVGAGSFSDRGLNTM